MSLRFLLLLTVPGLVAGCSRPAPVTVRDAPADRIMIVEDTARQDDGERASDVVSVTVREGGNWRTERFFVRGQALVYVFNARATAAGAAPRPGPPPGEFSTEATLRTIREFVPASRSRWFAYRGRAGHGPGTAGQAAGDARAYDFYEGQAPGGSAGATARGMRMYVNRDTGLLEYQDCDRGGGVATKAIAYYGHRPLPAGLFNPDDTRVRSFEFLDHRVALRYENLQVYEETMLPRGAAAR